MHPGDLLPGILLESCYISAYLKLGYRLRQNPHTQMMDFAYWVAEGGARGFSFRGSASTYNSDLASETSRSRFLGAVLRAGLHAYGDYDAAGADRAKRSLTDLAVLWTAKFDPDAPPPAPGGPPPAVDFRPLGMGPAPGHQPVHGSARGLRGG